MPPHLNSHHPLLSRRPRPAHSPFPKIPSQSAEAPALDHPVIQSVFVGTRPAPSTSVLSSTISRAVEHPHPRHLTRPQPATPPANAPVHTTPPPSLPHAKTTPHARTRHLFLDIHLARTQASENTQLLSNPTPSPRARQSDQRCHSPAS